MISVIRIMRFCTLIAFCSQLRAMETDPTTTNQQSVSVVFQKDKRSLKDIIETPGGLFTSSKKIEHLENPQVVVWYSGEDGLSEKSYDFYEQNFIKPFRKAYGTKPYSLFLYDLSAWKGLRDRKISLTTTNNTLLATLYPNNKQITPLYSREFFQYLLTTQNEKESALFNTIFTQRKEIWSKSKNTHENGIKIADIMPNIFKGKEDLDTAKAYSALQYLEGLWIVLAILGQGLLNKDQSTNTSRSIVFLLPNDELEYYQHGTCFQEDLQKLIKLTESLNKQTPKLNVYFQKFRYGKGKQQEKPYLWQQNDVLYTKKNIKNKEETSL
jgi:hypothetical protein